MSALVRLQTIIFLLIVFFLPFQVGLHFWPAFSYVHGIRIDYLSPTLYLLDILIVGWILLCIREIRGIGEIWEKAKTPTHILLGLFVLDLILNIFLSKSQGAHIFGLIKLGEFGLFGWLVARTFFKKNIALFVRVLSASAIASALLAIWQFVNQSSVGGPWYFLGERTFNSSTIGISTVNLNSQILRAYGAFPHPNVAAFFFLLSCVFALMRISHEKKLMWKILLMVAIVLSTVGLVVTFSRISILLTVIFFLYYFLRQVAARTRMVSLGVLSGVFAGLGMLGFFGWFGDFRIVQFLLRGIDFRGELFAQSLKILSENPYFGIGLNNFFIHQAPLINTISPINFQPPHNIFVLALLSLGLFGWWIVPVGLIWAVRRVWGASAKSFGPLRREASEPWDFYRSILFILVSIVIVGMFDHFFLTVEQGQIILALLLGLSFANLKS